MTIDNSAINKFWDWFKSISTELLSNDTYQNLISQLDERVNNLGPISWEIGPWPNGKQFFALSPNLNPEELAFTKHIISLAPPCNGWHFLPSKPPKNWLGIWNMKNEKGLTIHVDASTWQYVLYQFDDGTFAIDIKASGIDGNEDTRLMAVDIALTGYIGEEDFMASISDIQIVDEFEDAILSKMTSIEHIKAHLESLR